MFLVITTSWSQNTYSIPALRMISYRTIGLIEDYEKFSRFSNRDDANNFISLFEKSNPLHVNDIIPDNKMDQMLTPQHYISNLKKYFNQVLVSIDIDSIAFPSNINNQHAIKAFVKKHVECTTKNCHISYKDSMNLVLDINFEYVNDSVSNFLIQKISFLYPRGRFIYFRTHNGRTENTNFNMLINNQLYKSDNKGFVKIEVLDTEKSYSIKSFDDVFPQSYVFTNYEDFEKKSSVQDTCTSILTVDVLFKPLYWQTEFYASTQVGSKDYSVANPYSSSMINVKNEKASDFGFKVGYRIFNNNKFTGFMIKTGVSYKSFSLNSFVEDIQYSYNEIDSDKDAYLRLIQIKEFKEETSLGYISVPLSITRIFPFSHFTIAIGLEQSMMFNLKANSSLQTNAEYKGYYSQFFNLTIDQNGYYDFGKYQLEMDNEFYAKNNLFLTSLFVEFQRKINNNSMISFAIIAQTNTSGMVESNDKKYISRNASELYSLSSFQKEYEMNNVMLQLGYSISF